MATKFASQNRDRCEHAAGNDVARFLQTRSRLAERFEPVNKRDLSTGENGEFAARNVSLCPNVSFAGKQNLTKRRGDESATSAECLGSR